MGSRGHSQTKIFIFWVNKKTREKLRALGKHQEFCLDGSVATLILQNQQECIPIGYICPLRWLLLHVSIGVPIWDHTPRTTPPLMTTS